MISYSRQIELTRELCDIKSVSGSEREVADFVAHFFEKLNTKLPNQLPNQRIFEVIRPEYDGKVGNQVVVRTNFALPKRVILAGHIDTVPISVKTDNFPSHFGEVEGNDCIIGRGTVDMKAGDAVFLALAEDIAMRFVADQDYRPKHDITFIFYDNEEVAANLNGLGHISDYHSSLLSADFAILGEPTASKVEAGCNGTLRFNVTLTGKAAHSARPWVGDDAIHKLLPVLQILREWNAEKHIENVAGLEYIESLNATMVNGGIAPNVIPDECKVQINYRFAPSKRLVQAKEYIDALFSGFEVDYIDESESGYPGLDLEVVQEFAATQERITGDKVGAKYGWTDVARFSALGVPALNFGPGDALLAHHDEESCPLTQIDTAYAVLREYFVGKND